MGAAASPAAIIATPMGAQGEATPEATPDATAVADAIETAEAELEGGRGDRDPVPVAALAA